jgi:aminoglycoside phosphotransferase (APT) family kinase protein
LAALSADSVFGHGDFWCGNILLDQANIAVVDWECARSHMHPAFDLLTYIFTLSPRRPSMRAGVRGYYNVLVYNIMETILKSSAYTHAYRSAIDRYCSARKLDTKEICMYVPVFLAQMAHRVHLADPDAEARPGGNPWVEVLHQCMENPGPLFRT